jgi:DNA helicase-2/ATP-dependent DNA helicase PcrA
MATGTTLQVDEERRLIYVAMTRAKDHLTVIVPQRFYTHQQGPGGDRHVYATRTRFIPDTLTSAFEVTSSPHTKEDAAPLGLVVDLAARMRAVWT